jgi:hypothetical protein
VDSFRPDDRELSTSVCTTARAAPKAVVVRWPLSARS